MSTLATLSVVARMLLSAPQIHVDILALKVMLGGGAFGEQLDHVGGQVEVPRKPPCVSRRQREHNEEGAPTRGQICRCLDLGLSDLQKHRQ